MPYKVKPHLHVKIWFSPERELFMNQENQLRLVRMRVKNPKSIIHLVYSKALLSPEATTDLMNFCKTHKIIPISVEEDIHPQDDDEEENNLYVIYNKELQAFIHKRGGNLASISDVIRWIKAVYSRGIYTDFDVEVETDALPPEIEVDAPILLRIGGMHMPLNGHELYSLVLNNDTIAVAGDDDLTHEKIKAIQRQIINAYRGFSYSTFGRTMRDQVMRYRGTDIVSQSLPGDPQLLLEFFIPEYRRIVIELKKLGLYPDALPDPIELRKQILANPPIATADDIKAFEINIKQLALNKSCRKKARRILNMSPDDLQRHLNADELHFLMMMTVTHTTGPIAIMLALFKDVILAPEEEVKIKIEPYAFKDRLRDALKSTNEYPLYCKGQTLIELDEAGVNAEIGEQGDASWLPGGVIRIKERESKMGQAACRIQRFFKTRPMRDLRRDDAPRSVPLLK